MEKREDNLCKILSGYNSLKFVCAVGEDASPAGVSPILYHGSYITCTSYFHKFNLLFHVLYLPFLRRE